MLSNFSNKIYDGVEITGILVYQFFLANRVFWYSGYLRHRVFRPDTLKKSYDVYFLSKYSRLEKALRQNRAWP